MSRAHVDGRYHRRQLDLFVTLRVFEKNYRLQDIQLSKIVAIRDSRVMIHDLKSQITNRQSRGQNRGGEYRARTGDLLVANQALSQLS